MARTQKPLDQDDLDPQDGPVDAEGVVEGEVADASASSEEPLYDTAVEVEVPVPEPVVDPQPLEPSTSPAVAAVEPPYVTVFITSNAHSVAIGESHFTLRAGNTLRVHQPIADELVRRKLARR